MGVYYMFKVKWEFLNYPQEGTGFLLNHPQELDLRVKLLKVNKYRWELRFYVQG